MRMKGELLVGFGFLGLMVAAMLIALSTPSRSRTTVEFTKKKNVPVVSDIRTFKESPRIQIPATDGYDKHYSIKVLAELKVGTGPNDISFDLGVDPKEFSDPGLSANISVGPNGEVFVNDPLSRRILVLNAAGAVARTIQLPILESESMGDFGVDESGYIYGLTGSADGHIGQHLIILDPSGTKVMGRVSLHEATELNVLGDGVVLVGDKTLPEEGDNLRFRAFDRRGNVISGQEQHNWDLNVYAHRFRDTTVQFERAGGTIDSPQYSLKVSKKNGAANRFQFIPEKAPGETFHSLMPLGFDAAGRYYILSKVAPDDITMAAIPVDQREAAIRTEVYVFDLSTGRGVKSVRLEPDLAQLGPTEDRFAVGLDGSIYQAQVIKVWQGENALPSGVRILKYSPKP